jgi:hypothetical protein
MIQEIDILENEILEKYPNVLDILLRDQTTQTNIFWATDDYQNMGKEFQYFSCIQTSCITGEFGQVIMPRVKKNKNLQQIRVREMAEVFTPSWVCNTQNNLIDNDWFGGDNIFNEEFTLDDGTNTWRGKKGKINFPKGKTWMDYVKESRLEIACGEAPYITSRYDATTGDFIPIEDRIGLLDRKLRIINENVETSSDWLEAAQVAYKNIYAFEWQGDSLLLARESMLITFIENYLFKFGKEPLLRSIKAIAEVISWNIWQMDGLKFVVPNSCKSKSSQTENLFGEIEIKSDKCEGCISDNFLRHNGKYCLIMDWDDKELGTKTKGKKIKFIDLIKN